MISSPVSSDLPTGSAGWPRLARHFPQSAATQVVLFVGGRAGGLLDHVLEAEPGRLPTHLECLGSEYDLTEMVSESAPEYHVTSENAVTCTPPAVEPGGVDPGADDPTTIGRERAAQLRDQAGRQRDVAARSRDDAAAQRDADAEVRDRQAAERLFPGDSEPQSKDSAAAGQDRTRSLEDRQVGAEDRIQAQLDRISALADRSAAARDRRHASVDGLTGVYSREAGLVELDRDVARIEYTGHRLVLAFVDVDHLKAVNDYHGHAAGDQLLQVVATTLQEALRSYDLVIRYGGDEFVCAIEGVDLEMAGPRFDRVNALLASGPDRCSVTVGLAAWRTGDSAASLIDRADADLYRRRQHRRARATPGE